MITTPGPLSGRDRVASLMVVESRLEEPPPSVVLTAASIRGVRYGSPPLMALELPSAHAVRSKKVCAMINEDCARVDFPYIIVTTIHVC